MKQKQQVREREGGREGGEGDIDVFPLCIIRDLLLLLSYCSHSIILISSKQCKKNW